VENISTHISGENIKPAVGISRCLLGERVRYDARAIPSPHFIEKLVEIFELVPVCPEIEAGLSLPRPPVQLTDNIDTPRLTGRDDSTLDVTEQMIEYSRQKMKYLTDLDGYVFKSRSPSCGLNSTPVFIGGNCVTQTSRGVFARAVCEVYPQLPLIDDCDLESTEKLNAFIEKVLYHYHHRLQRI
jgi:uncharacterized protein YbbK (DUF523 family)